MLTGLSLTELAARIEGNKTLKRDYIVPTNEASMIIQSDSTPVLAFDMKVPAAVSALLAADSGLAIRDTAHDQIAARLDIPRKYYDRMLAKEPELLANNVNTWFKANPERRMVRTLGGEVRAFLSDRYNRIENEEIAEVALPILARIPDVRIVSCEVTDRRMYIQAVSPRVQGEVKKGDIVQAGVIISNSEIGHGAVSVSPLVYRLACLNGMVRNDAKFRAYHVGRQAADTEALWADDTRKADDRAILLKVRDMITAAVDEAQFAQAVERMTALTEGRVTGDPAKAVEVLAQKVGASEAEAGGILRALIEGGDLSAWGMLNAVTAQAHTVKNYDRAVEFEAAGGTLLELPKTEWKRILEAA